MEGIVQLALIEPAAALHFAQDAPQRTPPPGRIPLVNLQDLFYVEGWLLAAIQAFDWIDCLLQGRIAVENPLALKAEQYLRALYSGDTARVDGLVSADIVISYPAFEKLFGTSALRGRESAKDFAIHFSGRWADQKLDVQESISEGRKVVLLWEFSARYLGPQSPEPPTTHERSTWGGITLIEFDGSGQICAEIGEESSPGPIGRTKSTGSP